mgnify:CR=1 FL=1
MGVINVELPVTLEIRMEGQAEQTLLESVGNEVAPRNVEEHLCFGSFGAVIGQDQDTAGLFHKKEAIRTVRRNHCRHGQGELHLREDRFEGDLIVDVVLASRQVDVGKLERLACCVRGVDHLDPEGEDKENIDSDKMTDTVLEWWNNSNKLNV